MALIVIIGSQAVGKMTVGMELAKNLDAKLLFNHQTIDLFANYLGYSEAAFKLSDTTRKELFKAFVNNTAENTTKTMIFTVLIDFDSREDIEFLNDIGTIFLEAQQTVYFIELIADLAERLKRNVHEQRLKMKPSKRNLDFSKRDLLESLEKYRLESHPSELSELFPKVSSIKIDNTFLSPKEVSQIIINQFNFDLMP